MLTQNFEQSQTYHCFKIDNIIQCDILTDTDGYRSTCPTNLDILLRILLPRLNPNPHAS
ncbi:MAG: hypothetical protein QG558_1017 [Campylobacterota bacterium]|nr:hypothetical protein [Campylobacterota bacterium]